MDGSRITLRCFTEDLGLALPGVDSELSAEHPIADELLARAPTAPAGLKHAYAYFSRLHDAGRLLPTPDDAARIRLEAAARRYRKFSTEIPVAVGEARESPGHCISAVFDDVIPGRMLLVTGQACDELWVAISTVDLYGAGVELRTRDIIFALIEQAAGPGEWEAVSAWPEGELSWFEVARYGLLEA